MASPVPDEAVLSSLIIDMTVIFTTAYTNLCLNPKQAVYLLLIIGLSHKLPWSLSGCMIKTSHWFYSNISKLYRCICCSETVNLAAIMICC